MRGVAFFLCTFYLLSFDFKHRSLIPTSIFPRFIARLFLADHHSSTAYSSLGTAKSSTLLQLLLSSPSADKIATSLPAVSRHLLAILVATIVLSSYSFVEILALNSLVKIQKVAQAEQSPWTRDPFPP
jgi:ABC-type spermidine/putrescine transport system permease subunit I